MENIQEHPEVMEVITKQAVINGFYNAVFEGKLLHLSINMHEHQELISALGHAKIPYVIDMPQDSSKLSPEISNIHRLVERFRHHHKNLSNQLLGPYTLQEILSKRKLTGHKSLSFTITNQFAFDKEELNQFKTLIEKAIALYKSEFSVIDKHGLQHLSIKHEQNIEDVIREYETDIERLENLHQRYNRAFLQEKSHIIEQSGHKLQSLKTALQNMEFALEQYTFKHGNVDAQKPGLLSLNKALKLQYEDWTSLLEVISKEIDAQNIIVAEPYIQNKALAIADIRMTMSAVQMKITKFWDKIDKEVDDQLKRINHINLFNPVFQELFSELSEILRSMTAKGIYAKYFECNARSSLKQLEYLDEAIFTLRKEIEDLKRIPEYFKWKHFFDAQSPLTKHILTSLQNHEKEEWQEIFETNYINTYCEHELLKIDKFTDRDYVAMMDGAKRLKQFVNSGSDFKTSEWQGASMIVFNQSGFINETDSEEFFKEELPLKVEKPIAETHLTDQISVAKSIARAVMSISQKFKVYHMQKANVLCVDDSILPHLFVGEMKKFGLKEFGLDHYGEERLIESLITTDKPQYLIIRDGLLNVGNTNRLFSQLVTIQALQTAGYKLINVDTLSTREDSFKIRAFITEEIKSSYQV